MIKSLDIKNFRGIRSITLNEMSRINVFVGINGAGKTSVLEAITLAIGGGSEPFRFLAKKRGVDSAKLSISSLFISDEKNKNPKITTSSSSKKTNRILSIKPLEYEEARNQIYRVSPHGREYLEDKSESNSEGEDLHGISMSYQVAAGQVLTAMYALHHNHFHSDESQLQKAIRDRVFYISSRQATSIRETAKMLSHVQNDYEKEENLYRSLRVMEPNLRRLRTVMLDDDNVNVIADFKKGKSMPINMIGDGFCRLALILTGLHHTGATALVVDDIDSGIHYERMNDVWKTIEKTATENNIQVFCVTHSEEMLKASLEGLSENKDSIMVYRLSKKGDEHTSQGYDYELFKNTLKLQMPVR